MTGWRLWLFAAVLTLTGMAAGLSLAHVSQAPIEFYGNSQYWQRRALGYFRALSASHARVVELEADLKVKTECKEK
ncbi:hypothetical protein JQ594_05225 [Bradyrhizobium manausense]|uniref:hypothetical protein n=1 Tax=Bradyrhizobium manausense TaxID=989370 RepID=UPI001BA75BF3|nr:hypothetical protein [Bradyrhizobium manausense]MBR0685306.1 hypothetical protein [Bradyrhizobium manausense]